MTNFFSFLVLSHHYYLHGHLLGSMIFESNRHFFISLLINASTSLAYVPDFTDIKLHAGDKFKKKGGDEILVLTIPHNLRILKASSKFVIP